MTGTRIYSGAPFEAMAGYARAVVDPPYVFVSGTTGFDPETLQFPESVEAQCENCFATIGRALAKAGATMDDLVRIRVYVASRAEFERIKPIIKRHCDRARPANTTVLAELVEPYMRVEIEVTARLSALEQGRP